MVIKIYNKKQQVGFVDKNGFVKFIVGPDLNPVIDAAMGNITQVEDDAGNIQFVPSIPPLEQKLLFMENNLNFIIKK